MEAPNSAAAAPQRTSARPLPTAITAACIIAGILATLGGLSVLSTRRIIERDASEIFSAGALAATAGLHAEFLASPPTEEPQRTQARDANERAITALIAALPEAVTVDVGGIRGDSMTVLAARTVHPSAASGSPRAQPRPGQSTYITDDVRAAWRSGRPYVETMESRLAFASGFRAIAPVRSADGTVAGYVAVAADAARYVRWEAELRDTILLGLAVSLAVAGLAGLGVYRVETSRAESGRQLIAAKEAAEATARSRGEFLANMSHEIRTPLHGVLGMTEALLATPHSEADKRSLSVINRSASSLLGILNDILDYSKLEAGRVDLMNSPFDPRALVDDVTDLFAVRAEEKTLDLAVRETTRADHWPVGDAARIRQVLLNIVGNAVKFTEKGSVQVELSTVTIGRKTVVLRLVVRDTGIGIARDVQERVFEQFSQAETSTTRRFGGTGLGLTISRQLVLLMGGSISVSSVPGTGSEFVVNIQLPAADTKVDPPVVPNFPPGVRVLICTKLEATRAALAELCARERFSVESCTTSDDALRSIARNKNFAAVFCEAAAGTDLSDDPHPLAGAGPPLVMLTTVHHPLNNSTLSALGAVAQLRRPVRQDHFGALITDLAAGRLRTPPSPGVPGGIASVPSPTVVTGRSREPTPQIPAPEHFDTSKVGAPRVLVVDDVELNLIVARAMLGSLGSKVLTAAGGEEAVEMLAREPVDLVLMDCHMPGIDGYEVTRAVRGAVGPNRDTPIVALSASAFAEDRERAIASGMNDFAAKPIELEVLRGVLDRWTGQRVHPPESPATVN